MLAWIVLDPIFRIVPIRTNRHRRTHADRDGIYTHGTPYAKNVNPALCKWHNCYMGLQLRIHGPICRVYAPDGSPASSTILVRLHSRHPSF